MSKFGWSYPAGAASDPGAPYNQDDPAIVDDAIAGRDLQCPHCGETAEWFRDVDPGGFPSDLTAPEVQNEGWHCAECDWAQEAIDADWARTDQYKKELRPRIDAVQDTINATREHSAPTLDDIFQHAPNGDFSWNQDEAGDWHVYLCGERDCPTQWHLSAPFINMGRADGKRWIETGTRDEDGDWETDARWDDGDDWDNSDVAWSLARDSSDYFRGWAQYWLHCAQTMTDPRGQRIGPPITGINFIVLALKSAEEMAKYLIPAR